MRPKIGAHVSVAGGLYKAVEYAEKIGADCIQIFGASPRRWEAKMPDTGVVEKFKQEIERSGIGPVYLHAAYLVNLASINQEIVLRSIKNLAAHLQIAETLGARGLIFHIGSGEEAKKEDAMTKVVAGVKQVLKKVPGKAKLLLENSAGGVRKLGSNAKEIGEILKNIESGRVGVCLDTAHALAAGAIEKYEPQEIKRFLDEWDFEVGLENVWALHLNDSKSAYNSQRDHHENIGKGFIGLAGFKNLAKEKRLWDKSWILEVPGFAKLGPDEENIEILKSCFS